MERETDNIQKSRMVKSHDIHLDAEYADWIAELKHRYRAAQVKASVRVNTEKLRYNWELGHDLVQKKAEERWGAGVVEQVSLDMQREFPDADGFSTTNLWYMKQWYLFYNEIDTKLQQAVGEIEDEKLQRPVAENQGAENEQDIKLQQVVGEIEDEKLHQTGGEFPVAFGLVPWGHHIAIIQQCAD